MIAYVSGQYRGVSFHVFYVPNIVVPIQNDSLYLYINKYIYYIKMKSGTE